MKIKGQLASPLAIGSGEDIDTDMDIIRDWEGNPFVPGTACAGALRQWLIYSNCQNDIDSLFGSNKRNEKDFRQSRLFVSDIIFTNPKVTVRNHVHLVHKTAVDMNKFDVEAIETGTAFTMLLEYFERESSKGNADEVLIERIIQGIVSGELKLGGKTNRGYGKLSVNKVFKKVFDYTTKEVVEDWLDWTPEKDMAEVSFSEFEDNRTPFESITLHLQIKQTLLIQDYKTEDDLDYTYLTSNGKAVIPGTTWAGAFRQRFQDILGCLGNNKEYVEHVVSALFGSKLDNDEGSPSVLQFEESIIGNYEPLKRTRNAIDRFSGATIDGALFTGESVCKGTTELTIRWKKNTRIFGDTSDQVIRGILYWLVQDLHHGLLAVGGETSVGRGVFELEDKKAMAKYKECCKEAIKFCLGSDKIENRED